MMQAITKSEVKEIIWPGKTFAIKRSVIGFDKLTSFFCKSYSAIYAVIRKLGIRPNGMPCAINYSVDNARHEADIAAAVPISGPVLEMEGIQTITIPKSNALLLSYFGSYEDMGPAYSILERYMSAHHMQKTWMLEEYLSDPPIEREPGKWKTNIYFILK